MVSRLSVSASVLERHPAGILSFRLFADKTLGCLGSLAQEITEEGGVHVGRVGVGCTHLVVMGKGGWEEGAKGEFFALLGVLIWSLSCF